jgi:signal transduction histidine kinase
VRLVRLVARGSVRLRLTLLYTALFAILGAALLGITYGLVAQSLPPQSSPDQIKPAQGGKGGKVGLPDICQLAKLDPGLASKCKAAYNEGLVTGATSQREETLHNLLVISLLALAAMTLISAGLGWLLAGRVLRPLHEITGAAQRASEDTLGERIALTGPDDELKRLADTFDAMLGRLDGAFAAQKRFVADASHELRTPLTLMRTAIDVTLAKPDRSGEQLEAMAIEVRGAVERSEALIDALLTLARSDRTAVTHEPVDLAAIAEDALEFAAARTPAGSDVAVDATLVEAPATGDRVLLERLAANLIDNAVAYNVPGGWVRLTTGTTPTASFLEVTNSGPAVAAEDVASLFVPFRRLAGRAGTPAGFGLGLSIVHAIATAHGARLNARARPTGGLEITVELSPSTS